MLAHGGLGPGGKAATCQPRGGAAGGPADTCTADSRLRSREKINLWFTPPSVASCCGRPRAITGVTACTRGRPPALAPGPAGPWTFELTLSLWVISLGR